MQKSVLMLTKLDTRKILVNVQNIQLVEANPDTVIILGGGKKLLVKESLEEIYNMLQEG
jgi:flagellar protein FlbD